MQLFIVVGHNPGHARAWTRPQRSPICHRSCHSALPCAQAALLVSTDALATFLEPGDEGFAAPERIFNMGTSFNTGARRACHTFRIACSVVVLAGIARGRKPQQQLVMF